MSVSTNWVSKRFLIHPFSLHKCSGHTIVFQFSLNLPRPLCIFGNIVNKSKIFICLPCHTYSKFAGQTISNNLLILV